MRQLSRSYVPKVLRISFVALLAAILPVLASDPPRTPAADLVPCPGSDGLTAGRTSGFPARPAAPATKARTGRAVRLALTDGKVLDPKDWPTAQEKVPVACYVGEINEAVLGDKARERYRPSLDPVRQEGKLLGAAAPPPPPPAEAPATAVLEINAAAQAVALPKLELIKAGYTKLDTPAWLPAEKCLLLTDLEQQKLWRLDLPDKFAVVREEACRGKVGPEGRFYGILGDKLVSWKPGEEPRIILEKAAGGKDFSLNDLAVGPTGFLYFTTLKDPDLGRLSTVDLKKQTVAVAFDATASADLAGLANPNGVAVSPDGKFLYVGISNYQNRKTSGVYRFPLRADGTLDVAAGKAKPWAPVAAPDGIAVGPDGNIYCTAGSVVHIYSPEAKSLGTIKIPKDSGTNLCFGGADGRTLFVTTHTALWSGRIDAPAQ